MRPLAVALLLLISTIGQAAEPALLDLRDVSPLRDWFQRQSGSVRVIALLNAGCTSCLQGFAEIQKTLKDLADPHVRVAVVWIRLAPGDERSAAVKFSSEFTDGRITYFWDPYRASGETWQSVLKLQGAAWDVYMVYGAASNWNEPDLDPGPPAFWMHQLKQVPQAPALNQKLLEQKIRSLLP